MDSKEMCPILYDELQSFFTFIAELVCWCKRVSLMAPPFIFLIQKYFYAHLSYFQESVPLDCLSAWIISSTEKNRRPRIFQSISSKQYFLSNLTSCLFICSNRFVYVEIRRAEITQKQIWDILIYKKLVYKMKIIKTAIVINIAIVLIYKKTVSLVITHQSSQASLDPEDYLL